MRISALINGQPVQIVDIERNGMDTYVHYINTQSGPGTLTSVKFSSSAIADVYIPISSSATWLA